MKTFIETKDSLKVRDIKEISQKLNRYAQGDADFIKETDDMKLLKAKVKNK
jgi:hypothetical protein